MRRILCCFVLIIPVGAKSQDGRFAMRVGVSTGKTEEVKKVMFISETIVSHEKNFAKEWYWGVGIGKTTTKYDHNTMSGRNKFHKVTFLTIPVYLKKRSPITRNIIGFVEGGVSGSYCYKEQIDIHNLPGEEKISIRWPGYAIAGFVNFGFRTKINNVFYLDVNLGAKYDIYTHYSNPLHKLSQNSRMMGVSIYKKF